MLFNGPITEASQFFSSTLLPQVIFVGDAPDRALFLSWVAMNQFQQLAIISVIERGSAEEAQLDQVVAEKGIVPRVHIVPPKGRGLTPTCLYKESFKEAIVAQAIATAGGIMMSYGDVVDVISKGYLDKEQRNASEEVRRGLGRINAAAGVGAPAAASVPAVPLAFASAATSSPTPAPVASKPTTAAPTTSSSTAATTTTTAATASSSTLPNVKISLRLADGKAHAVYTNNLWNAATQLAKGGKFALEMGKGEAVQRAFTADEMQTLPITEGCIVRLNLDPPGVVSRPASAASPTPVVTAAPVAAPAPAASPSSPTAAAGAVEVRFTLPTGENHTLKFEPTTTLGEVRTEVAKQFITNNQAIAAYCNTNSLSTSEFNLVVAYPPKKLENDDGTNAKALKELGLGSKFALRVVMAFIGGSGGAAPAPAANTPGVLGRITGFLRHPGGGQ